MKRVEGVLWAAVLAWGCSAEPIPRGIREPVGLARSSRALEGHPSATPRAAAETALDLEQFSPLLSLPAYAAAAEAMEAGDVALAARAAGAVPREAVPGIDPQSVALLVARLREQAGDWEGAVSAYEQASAPPWTLSGYATLGAARGLLALGRGDQALSRLRAAPVDGPSASDAGELTAEALLVVGEKDAAIAAFRRCVEPEGAFVPGRALRLAEVLLSRAETGTEGGADSIEALGLARRALARAPNDPDVVARGHAAEGRALSLIPEKDRAALARPPVSEQLTAVRALLDARDALGAVQAVEPLLAALGDGQRWSPAGCEADLEYARGLAGLRKWGRAVELASQIFEHCTDREIRARALFLAGKYADSDKRFAQAVKFYETLEKEFHDHRLADDARLRAALSYGELGAEGQLTELLNRMPDDYPEGDMVLDGLFELSARRFGRGDWAGALGVLDRAASFPGASSLDRGQDLVGREQYFRARAWAAAGERDRSLSEYERIVVEAPLSYYMLQAHTRLFAADPDRAKKALALARSRADRDSFRIPHRPEFDSPGFRRALELLRVGDMTDAAREFDALGIGHTGASPEILWGIALLYARSGSASLSHKVVQGVPRDWLGKWPSGDFRRAWEIAFPRPYQAIVDGAARKNGVPEFLVYAVMREESSFDPQAESPARAYGLMQLIEPTARQFGRALGLKPDRTLLKKPAVNVAIGCRVLSELTRSFQENPLLAIPGYNAGPGASRRWLEARPEADFDVWVELIPYGETRKYTKRVLASRATYAFLYAPEQADAALRLPLRLAAE